MVSQPVVAPEAQPDPLARNRDFRVVLVSQGISTLGDAVNFTALPLLVLALTGSGFAMGVVAAVQAISDFAFAMIAGALADRADRKRMMFLADLGRALLTAVIPISVLLNGPTLAVILVVTAPMSVLRAVFRAAYTASVPGLVGRSQVGRATGIFESVYTAGFIVGPAIAGVLATTIGPGYTLAIDAASFAVSSLGLLLVTRPLRAAIDRPPTRMIDDIREGVAFVARHPVLRALILMFGLSTLALAPTVNALAIRITRDLGLSEAVFGAVLAASGVGAVAGSLAAGWIGQRIGLASLLLVGWFGVGAMSVATALLDQVPAIVALGVASGAAEALVVVAYVTLRTAWSPDHLLGRVSSTARSVSLALQPIGLLVGGALMDVSSGTTTLAVMGVAMCLVAVAFAFVGPLRSASDPP